jgi:hypothetical protein
MEKNVGLWIDHEKAYLIELQNSEEVRRASLTSDVERRVKHIGGGRAVQPYGGFDAPAEIRASRRRANQIKAWCREVIEAVAGADRIFILGPGEAKKELLTEMDKHNGLGKKVVAMETADQMTENQVAARVREFFLNEGKDNIPSYRRPPGA